MNTPATNMNTATSPSEFQLTDLGNAERLVSEHGCNLRYCATNERWYVWSGTSWQADDDGKVMRLAKQTVRAMKKAAASIADRERADILWDHAHRSESSGRLQAMVGLARSEPSVLIAADVLDADPWLFNCRNMTVDLKTGEAHPHRQADMCSIVAPVKYDPEAKAPEWTRFIGRIFDGNDGLIAYVQKFLGMCLTGDIREQYFHVFHGSGANGKSTLLDQVLAVMGAYAGIAPDSLLTQRGRDEHPTEIADLLGKRFIVASETEETARLRTSLVKRMTGDAMLKARFMRQDYFSFHRTFKIVLMTNNPPKIDEDSEATRRRVRMVPFEVVIPAHERDVDLPTKLKREASGILNWLIEGCLAWQREGFAAPLEVTAASAQYFEENDRGFGEFVTNCTTRYPGARATRADLFTEYERHCQRIGERSPMAAGTFYERLRRLEGVTDLKFRRDDKVQRGFEGISVCLGGEHV